MAGSRIIMALTAAVVLGCSVPSSIHAPSPPEIAMTYEGQLALNGNMIPVRTLLIREAERVRRGYYVFLDQGKWLPGTLSECAEIAPLQVRCRWEDPYGVGRMQMTVAQNWSAFDGFWVSGLEGGGEEHPWNGRLAGPQPALITSRRVSHPIIATASTSTSNCGNARAVITT